MTEKNELVFIEPSQVPNLFKGAKGRDWNKIFNQIPVGKVLPMTEKDYGSAGNIRAMVKQYNENKENKKNGKVLKAMGRTDKETNKVTVYVQRVA
jgi:hypothetical protein